MHAHATASSVKDCIVIARIVAGILTKFGLESFLNQRVSTVCYPAQSCLPKPLVRLPDYTGEWTETVPISQNGFLL